jgi:hypothetical protein
MEYIFNEIIPANWKQGYFFFGDQKRIATVTDVKFISDTKVVVAHRAAAKLYLIEINNTTYKIIDSLLLKYNNIFFNPDLISIQNNRIYMTSYTNMSCIVDIVDDKFKFIKLFKINKYIHYHGCLIKNNLVYYGGVTNNTPLTIYDINTNKFVNITTNYKKRIKSINIYIIMIK